MILLPCLTVAIIELKYNLNRCLKKTLNIKVNVICIDHVDRDQFCGNMTTCIAHGPTQTKTSFTTREIRDGKGLLF